jgi:hypothetical protein
MGQLGAVPVELQFERWVRHPAKRSRNHQREKPPLKVDRPGKHALSADGA